jgi:rRNA processing protein Krr1/Pno1
MADTVGLLKVIVSHGKKLAIRDFTSSDPYVIVRVGDAVSLLPRQFHFDEAIVFVFACEFCINILSLQLSLRIL